MTLKVSNFNKPTPKRWRNLGNAAMFFGVWAQPAITGAPDDVMGHAVKFWLGFCIGAVCTGIKAITMFMGEEESNV